MVPWDSPGERGLTQCRLVERGKVPRRKKRENMTSFKVFGDLREPPPDCPHCSRACVVPGTGEAYDALRPLFRGTQGRPRRACVGKSQADTHPSGVGDT